MRRTEESFTEILKRFCKLTFMKLFTPFASMILYSLDSLSILSISFLDTVSSAYQ